MLIGEIFLCQLNCLKQILCVRSTMKCVSDEIYLLKFVLEKIHRVLCSKIGTKIKLLQFGDTPGFTNNQIKHLRLVVQKLFN